jgi:hypothetical protein
MLIQFCDWKNNWEEFSKNVNGEMEIIKNPSVGAAGSFYTINVFIKVSLFEIIISQDGGGSNDEVGISYIEFKSTIINFISYNLALYQKGFFERILNSNKIKTGSKIFDSKFGISCSEKTVATNLFNDVRVQSFFLNNSFLVFNVQRKTSMVTLRNMEVKIYKKAELQELLDKFVHILELIHKSNP